MSLPHPSLFFEGWGAFGELKEEAQGRDLLPSADERVDRLLGGCKKREYFLGNVPRPQFVF
jgi:hypothetical protein